MDDMKFQGKTILVLGSNVSSDDIVYYAKKNGAHTIVADYYPSEKSKAKQIADEAVCISTADIDSLQQLAIERNVDAVFSGISEFNILKAMDLSERLGLPFYCSKAQWDSIESKESFRRLCIAHSVPCPLEYYHGSSVDECVESVNEWPVVVKPVDASASEGVSFCNDEQELRDAFSNALLASQKSVVIVEEYVQGSEFTAHYTLHNGKATLSCIDNRYPVAVHKGAVTTVPVARIYPNLHLGAYVKQVNPHMVRLVESIGVKEGVLFVQGIYNEQNNSFAVFEAGLRSAGEAPYRFLKDINEVNYLSNMIDGVLLGRTDFDVSKEDPYLQGKCAGIISFVAYGGHQVGAIFGLEEAVAKTTSVIAYENRYPVGSITPDTDTLRQLMIRFVMESDSRESMARDIAFLNEHIDVRDVNGNDMVIKMDPERLFGLE